MNHKLKPPVDAFAIGDRGPAAEPTNRKRTPLPAQPMIGFPPRLPTGQTPSALRTQATTPAERSSVRLQHAAHVGEEAGQRPAVQRAQVHTVARSPSHRGIRPTSAPRPPVPARGEQGQEQGG
jgi:hypothetical protein